MKSFLKKLWNDESAQGATEYILLLVVVVMIGLIFKDRIRELVSGKLEELSAGMGDFKTK